MLETSYTLGWDFYILAVRNREVDALLRWLLTQAGFTVVPGKYFG